MIEFDFVKPSSVAEAVTALAAEGAQALSGGQTLTPTMKQRLATPAVLVSLTGIAALRGVSVAGGVVTVGAATPHADGGQDRRGVPRAGRPGRRHRRPGGAQPWYHRRQSGQQ